MNASKRYLLDTNIILRFLTGDPVPQATAARKLFGRARSGEIELEVSPVVTAEAMYTLISFYGVERKEAAVKLSQLLQQSGIKLRDRELVIQALSRLETTNVAFADAYLAAGAAEQKIPIASFDRDFDKFKDITRFEPPA